MANATLEMMQEIEGAAQAVLESYEAQIDGLRDQVKTHLDQVASSYDQETARLISERQAQSEATLTQLEKELEETVARNEAAVQGAMTAQREGLVQAIVDKVVARYGN